MRAVITEPPSSASAIGTISQSTVMMADHRPTITASCDTDAIAITLNPGRRRNPTTRAMPSTGERAEV